MNTKTFILFLLLSAILAGCSSLYKTDPSAGDRISKLLSYQVAGKDDLGEYSGEVVILRRIASNKVDAIRTIQYKSGDALRAVGSGVFNNREYRIQFSSAVVLKTAIKELVPKSLPKDAKSPLSVFLTGKLSDDKKSAVVRVLTREDKKSRKGLEKWSFKEKLKAPSPHVKATSIKRNSWNAINLSLKNASSIKITVRDAATPLGIFLPKGEKPPKWQQYPDDDRPLPLFGDSGKAGFPQMQTVSDGAVWVKNFSKQEMDREWIFWYRDDFLLEARDIDFRVEILPRQWLPFLCDPWVKIDISPNVVAAGEPININVQARAWAGLNMYWWFGVTGLSQFDRAFIQSGNGLTYGDHDWTIQIDEPGNYTFGANSRDVLYPVPGIAHQASEGCGLSYDTVEVRDPGSRSYSVAFIILAPVGTDTNSAAFQTLLARVNGIKAQLPAQFSTSTDGRGIVDVSYPTVVLTPPGPVYGISDPSNMWNFIANTLNNEFYMHHPDDFDFVAIYETYPDVTIGSRHLTTRTRVAGFGITPYDTSASWGSAGRLRGIGLITDVNNMPDSYDFLDSRMHLLLHEVFGHQWGVSAARLTTGGSHFGIGIQSPNFSVLYARPWVKIDDTNYTTANIIDPATGTHKVIFHPWMLYVAGMKQRHEVPASFLDVSPDTPPAHRYDIVTTTGTSESITLDSVILESGDRYDVP